MNPTRAVPAAALAIAGALALGGCGAEAEAPAGDPAEPPAGAPAGTVVRITFDPDGRGSAEAGAARLACPSPRRAACERLQALEAWVFEPVPERRACTMIYGGPETGRIEGVVRGRPVDARFGRRNGCEIRRYEQVEGLLALARP